ncbi:hypothetical protein AFB00_25330 [Pseudonocardia sp. HH130630-07]|nr:hypothetical protein AFB00_25330 [Pseudonocardia sp. HH130630-07]
MVQYPDPRTASPGAAVPARSRPALAAEFEHLQENLRRVLAGLHWPAYRWQVIAEAEAWGVSGMLRNQLAPLPDGRYPSVDALVATLVAQLTARPRPTPAGGPPVPVRPAATARVRPAVPPGAPPRPAGTAAGA